MLTAKDYSAIQDKLDRIVLLRDDVQKVRDAKDKIIDTIIPKEIKDRVNEIEKDTLLKIVELTEQISELEDSIRKFVVDTKTTVKG